MQEVVLSPIAGAAIRRSCQPYTSRPRRPGLPASSRRRRAGLPSMRSRPASIIRAGFMSCRTVVCARRRDRCTAQARRPQGDQGLGDEEADEQGRLRNAERKPHNVAARRGWRRRRRDADRISFRSQFTVRHGARRQYIVPTSPIPMRWMRFPYRPGETEIREAGTKVTDLPAGPHQSHHWTKNVIASRDGSKLYVDRRLKQQRA